MLAFVVVLVCVAGVLPLIELLAERLDRQRYPAPGRYVANGQLHILEKGVDGPVVILESGLAATSVSWLHVQDAISKFARVVAYDRAGLGWSWRRNAPLSLSGLLADLHAVVKIVSPGAPVVLVGHSFGGLIVRAFAHAHPDCVRGAVMVDPVSLRTYAQPDDQHARRLRMGAKLATRGAWLAQFGVVRAALTLVARGQHKLPQLIGRASAGPGSSVMNRLATEIAKLPPETHGPISSHWSRPQSFRQMAEYLELLPEAARQAQGMPIPSEIPVIVLSAASATQTELAERDGWTSRHTQIQNTTHWIQLDRPDLIADSVAQLIMR